MSAEIERDLDIVGAWGLILEGVRRVQADLERDAVGTPGGPAGQEVLLRLGRTPAHRLPMSGVARELSLSSGGFTKIADRLAEAGLLRRTRCDNDRRVVYAELTPEGVCAATAIEARSAEAVQRRVLSVVSRAELESAAETLRALRDAG